MIDTTHQELGRRGRRQLTKKRQVIAEVDWKSAFAMIHPKAIYLVEGEQFEVQELRFREDEEKVAYVKRVQVDYFTDAVTAKGVWALDRFQGEAAGPAGGRAGSSRASSWWPSRWSGFKKIKFDTMENVGAGEVELPQQEMQTAGLWLTVRPEVLAAVSPDRDALVDGLRGLAYLLHHLAPLFLMCDVRDLGSWLGDAAPARAGPRRAPGPAGPHHRADAGPAARRGALRADRLPLRQPARRGRPDRAAVRPDRPAPRPRARDAPRPARAAPAARPASAR